MLGKENTRMTDLFNQVKVNQRQTTYYPTASNTRTAFMIGNANVSLTIFEGAIMCQN